MSFDIEKIKNCYELLYKKVTDARKIIKHPLTLTEKILIGHINSEHPLNFVRGDSYIEFKPDRVAMQDATAQMALLQFMQAGQETTAVPTTVHCDHLIIAKKGAKADLKEALKINKEVYDFLRSVAAKYGIGFWKPGSGVIHQIIFENYAFPGGLMIGTDSHTPTAGGLGMLSVGVGGADAVDVMVGMGWELKFPKVMGVKLTGELKNWASAKDVILKLAGMLTVKGATGYVIEYFGHGAESISATGKATICNMGAEVGATGSIFPYDKEMKAYLLATERKDILEEIPMIESYLCADEEVYNNPKDYYDKVIEINLSEIEPYINGPFTPDKAWTISEFKKAVEKEDFPKVVAAGLIGSCTNSSYEDLTRSLSLVEQALEKNIVLKADLLISPGSELLYETLHKEKVIQKFAKFGALVLTNACGPCIGQWERMGADKKEKNTIFTSFNRNFVKRNDGNPNTYAFVASPEIVTVMTMAGYTAFNPLTDTITNEKGQKIKLAPPQGSSLPKKGFSGFRKGLEKFLKAKNTIKIKISEKSERLQILQPFLPWDGQNLTNLRLLIKVKGKCTTDHISIAGPWLKYRGHLDNISNNLLIGAVNAFNDKVNLVKNIITNNYNEVPKVARFYKNEGIGSVIIGEENYGEGSSREHAAMEPRYLGVKAVIVKSFARIHETNLKKQGILALTFAEPTDYDTILEDDSFDIVGLNSFGENKFITLIITHKNGSKEEIHLKHTFNQAQISWFKAGSALNLIKNKNR